MQLDHTYVVCAYGDSPYLRECLDSLKAQTRPSVILLTTSTPSPYLEQMAREYDAGYVVRRGKSSIGADWNFGLSQVKTPYATIAHQDDTYAPQYGEWVMAQLTAYSDSLICHTRYQEKIGDRITADTVNLKIKNLMSRFVNLFAPRCRWLRSRVLALGDFVGCPSVSYHLENLKDFTFDDSLHVTLDWDGWRRIFRRKGRICYVKQCAMTHRLHEGAETSAAIADHTRQQEDLLMFERFWPKPIARFLAKRYQKSLETKK